MIYTVKTTPAKPHNAPPAPLPPFIPYEVRAAMDRRVIAKRDNTPINPNPKHSGGQSPHRKAWAAQLPEGRFTRDDAAAVWGVGRDCAQGRLEVLANTELIKRTPMNQRPVMWWREGE